jgi:hypothetical protein
VSTNLPTIAQSRAQAGRDIVGVLHQTNVNQARPTVIDDLLAKLQAEVDANEQTRNTIETLARFATRRAPDGIVGLEAKLVKGGRQGELIDAMEKKELFVKLVETWSLYASAQEIFACLLAKAEYEFNYFIQPQVGQLSRIEINQLINDKVIDPTTSACGGSTFTIDHNQAMGMIYWLAEQCFVRWHE